MTIMPPGSTGVGRGGVPLVRIGYHLVRGYKPDAVMSYVGR
jgi:hypothetical protein